MSPSLFIFLFQKWQQTLPDFEWCILGFSSFSRSTNIYVRTSAAGEILLNVRANEKLNFATARVKREKINERKKCPDLKSYIYIYFLYFLVNFFGYFTLYIDIYFGLRLLHWDFKVILGMTYVDWKHKYNHSVCQGICEILYTSIWPFILKNMQIHNISPKVECLICFMLLVIYLK